MADDLSSEGAAESRSEDTSGATEVDERAAKKERAIRRRVLLTITPLIPTVVVPWPKGGGFSWEAAERLDVDGFLWVPLLALLATLITLPKKRSLLVRSLLLGGVGVTMVAVVHEGMVAPRVIRQIFDRDIQRLDAYSLYVGLGLPLLAVTMELFAALDRRSRPRALLAGLGWGCLALGFFVPMRSDRVESMPFLMMTELVDDARREPVLLLLAAPMAMLLFLSLGAAAYSLLRLIGDEDRRERWRPRSGCLAIGIGALPALLITVVCTIGVFADGIGWLGAAYNGGVGLLGFWIGIPALLAAGLDGLATTARLAIGRGDAKHVRAARLGIAALGGASLLTCLTPIATGLLPDSRESAAAEVLVDAAEEVVRTAGGAEPDPRFVGGYSEFDLRGSRGVLSEAIGGADAELVYATWEFTVRGRSQGTVTVGIDPSAELHYLDARTALDRYPEPGMLEHASPPLAGLAARIDEGLTSVGCLPASSPPDLPRLTADPSSIAEVCNPIGDEDRRRRIRDLPFENATTGGTGRYRVWLRANGSIHVLEGRLYSHEGRLWIGRASIPEAQ